MADLTAETRLIANLESCAELNDDPEAAHAAADEALLNYFEATLSTTQAHLIRQAFDGVRKWYA